MNVSTLLSAVEQGVALTREETRELIRNMTPWEKTTWTSNLNEYVRETLREVLSLVHPEWCEQQIRVSLYCLMQREAGEHPIYFNQFCRCRPNIDAMLKVTRDALGEDKFALLQLPLEDQTAAGAEASFTALRRFVTSVIRFTASVVSWPMSWVAFTANSIGFSQACFCAGVGLRIGWPVILRH